MRISDWSSYVCSSDLDATCIDALACVADHHDRLAAGVRVLDAELDVGQVLGLPLQAAAVLDQFRSGLRTTVAGEGVRQVAVADLHLGVRPGVVGGHEQAIGRASRRERVCQYVWISGVAVS